MVSRWAYGETFSDIPFKDLLQKLPEWIIKYGEDAVFDVSGTGEYIDESIYYKTHETEAEMENRIKQTQLSEIYKEKRERKLLAELKDKYE